MSNKFENQPIAFDEPWHATLFALTRALEQSGHLSPSEWSSIFGKGLSSQHHRVAPHRQNNFYLIWLSVFEYYVKQKKFVDAAEITETKESWQKAFESTPHGIPIALPSEDRSPQ